MIPAPGTETRLVEFALKTAEAAIRWIGCLMPCSVSGSDNAEKAAELQRALRALASALHADTLTTWGTPTGRNAEYVFERNLDMVSTALADGMASERVKREAR